MAYFKLQQIKIDISLSLLFFDQYLTQKPYNFTIQYYSNLYQIYKDMTDIEEFAKILSCWKDQQKKKIHDILKRIDALNLEVEDTFNKINKPIVNFHKQIQNCQIQLTEDVWFTEVLKIKKKLKKAEQNAKKKGAQKPVLAKKPSIHIEFPQQLFQGVRPSQLQIVKILFKNFVSNLPNYTQYMKDARTIQFIKNVNLELRKMFQDQLETKKNKKVDSICMHLSKDGSIKAKLEMLEGKKTPKQVAQDDQSAYKDEQTQRRIQEHIKEQFQMSQTGLYDEMKKNIFKGASQECRFCRKQTAYCDDMKQIRASDEPMTRFMKCNNCNKNWRD